MRAEASRQTPVKPRSPIKGLKGDTSIGIDMDVDSDMAVSIDWVPFSGVLGLLSRDLGLIEKAGLELILVRTIWLFVSVGGPVFEVLL